ncbi:MAG: ATP-dependent Clp protease proteolytic subunit [Sedimentisphaerales bacterium]
MMIFENTIKDILSKELLRLENKFKADVVFYFGEIRPELLRIFRDLIEDLKKDKKSKKALVIILNTPGGSADVAEKMVDITRKHYGEVYFVVPDIAMSAGTLFCMSGDKIYMDYSSSLGPVDPQVWNGKQWVPALGYLNKVEEFLNKEREGKLTRAEFLMLQNQDLAILSQCEQAKNLTETLLKKWLVEYKFKDWDKHRTNPAKKGKPVTGDEKVARAAEIAANLGDNKKWHTHSRMIGIKSLRELRLDIEDFSDDPALHLLIRSYNDLLTEYIARNNYTFFFHSRKFF